MANEKILVVEDDEDILELIRYNLTKEGYEVDTAMSGDTGLEKARSNKWDLVILDLMLPKIDGLEICKLLKNDPQTRNLNILILTAKGEEADVVTGLEMGADDYMTKPFSPRVLLARIKAVLRRQSTRNRPEPDIIRIHGLEIDIQRHRVHVSGEQVDLTSTEFNLLRFLARRPGWVFTRGQIVDAVHGDDYPVTDRSVDVQIVGLRKKLGDAQHLIETVRGVGYRFKE